MINKHELRLGNIVCDKVSGEWMIVDEIGESVGAVLINRDKYPLPKGWEMSPIPLSPEILEAAGFKKHEAFTYDYYYRVFLQTDTKGCEQQSKISIGRNGTEVFINNRWLCEVKYLHTLQNLFLSISGQELTVSPL